MDRKIINSINQQYNLKFQPLQTMNKYEELDNIGKGQFGLVKKIRRLSDNRLMVWKQVNYGPMTKQQKNQLVNEVNILKELSHDNIVKYYDHIVDKKYSKVYIIMEYCPGGDLSSVLAEIQKKGEYLDEDLIWKLFLQLVSALNYCHRKKILHRDLKPANIFIDSTRSNIKIGDFGLSRELGEHSEYAKTYVGTPYYMSPEQICAHKYNEKSDIWSLGCIIYELAALHRPFRASSFIQLGKKIESGSFEALPDRYSYNLRNLITRMLSTNIESRPSTSQLLSIPQLKIRLEQRQIRNRYQEIKRKQEIVKEKEQQYSAKIRQLEEMLVVASSDHKLKKSKSIMDSTAIPARVKAMWESNILC